MKVSDIIKKLFIAALNAIHPTGEPIKTRFVIYSALTLYIYIRPVSNSFSNP